MAFLNVSLVENPQSSIFTGSRLSFSLIAYSGTGYPLLSNANIIKYVNSENNTV